MIEVETHPLKPFLPSNAKLLMLGSFPPPQSRWKMDFYYPNYQNDMWRIFGLIFFKDKNYFLDLANKNFQEQKIREFLTEIGVGIFDTAFQVKRLQGNASDKFLEIVTPTDLAQLLKQIPKCHTIMTTGDKATDTLMLNFPEQSNKPMIGQSVQVHFESRELNLYRLPSSSRAYPLALEKKAEAYQHFFERIGLV
ncbi:MAG: uracil-DNA glycosylase family protein [Proteobacteria bacterium]|uniref:uracil-DNA glycosylase family protein n=1 Tax=Acinetobacter venetianus TaxID=52133 RepID=UPI00214FEFBE|nr:uracil-DNA glycosylase family protein [Acinetobacter venetianus]MCR4530575.1 uracil-DNA glycosylase family protein [Acinetobacter venetianus]MDA0697475.1 uracil-DNA glycosylase family protein [Pseudomonadota bacterium]MDA1254821.1 uracil-DNA glycosylase family protein [Pseudomonadota bacterium]